MDRIRLDAIAFDAGTQIREAINEQVVAEYAAARLADAPHGVRGLLRRAESQRQRTGNQKGQCIAATIVEIYNKPLGPRSAERLPDWWKQAE